MHHSLPSPRRPLLFIGGVHGDELEGVALAEGLLSWLKDHSREVQIPWALIPCLNLDGFLQRQRTNGHGVDLNRNYPCTNWEPSAKAPRYNPGPSPGSEPEIQSLVAWIKSYNPQLLMHFHSWKPMIVYAGEGARPTAQLFGATSGYEVTTDIGYPTPGSLSQFGMENNIPVICIEELDPTPRNEVWHRFAPAFSDLLLNPETLGLT